MGKALIVGGGEDGYYTVEVLHNRDRIDAEIEWLKQIIPELEKLENELSDQIATLEAERAMEYQMLRAQVNDIQQLLLRTL